MRRSPAGLLAVDAVFLGYLGLVSGLILFRQSAIPQASLLLAIHFGVGACLLALARATRAATVERALQTRVIFGYAAIPALFFSLSGLVPHANPFHAERILKRLDDLLFMGQNPSVLLDRLASPALTEYLQVVYSSYYVLPVVLFVALFRAGERRALERSLLGVVLSLLISYIGYFLVPATGPNVNLHGLYPWPSYDQELASGASTLPGLALAEPIRRAIYRVELIKHDCFPSAHTAMSLVVLLLARQFHRPTYLLLLVPVGSLIFSTVYLRYHYLVDVMAGVAVAAASLAAAPWIEAAFWRSLDPRRRRRLEEKPVAEA